MTIKIQSLAEIEQYERRVIAAAETSSAMLGKPLLGGLPLFFKLKFGDKIGQHPLENRALNFIEQLNQTFTHLVTFQAVRQLFQRHKNVHGYELNLGAQSGLDILSDDKGRTVAAEVFAAVSPKNNNKLEKDLKKVSESLAKSKYVFFFLPGSKLGHRKDLEKYGVEVWSVEIEPSHYGCLTSAC